jgi:hypothetical protein
MECGSNPYKTAPFKTARPGSRGTITLRFGNLSFMAPISSGESEYPPTARSVLMLAISGLLNSSSKTLRTFSIE